MEIKKQKKYTKTKIFVFLVIAALIYNVHSACTKPLKVEKISEQLNISEANAEKLYGIVKDALLFNWSKEDIIKYEQKSKRLQEITEEVSEILKISQSEASVAVAVINNILAGEESKDTSENTSPTSNYTDTQINDMINHWTNLCNKHVIWSDEEKQQMIDFYTNGIKETPDIYWKVYDDWKKLYGKEE